MMLFSVPPRPQLLARSRRFLSFSYAGARNLGEILEMEKIKDKTGDEIKEIWKEYHLHKKNAVGFAFTASQGATLLQRASECPFFIQPVFAGKGHYMLLSQFQSPRYFLLTYLQKYQEDPGSATPCITISVFDDYKGEDLILIRGDIYDQQVETDCTKIAASLLSNYLQDYDRIETFNKRPNDFDLSDYVKKAGIRWEGS